MSDLTLLTPVGRLVQGSLYEPQKEDMDGNPLVYKTGAKKGDPRDNYYFGLAILKKGETHWNQTPWGQVIWNFGKQMFPSGQYNHPDFSWKIKDGDSEKQIKIEEPLRWCDKIGYPKHWVLNFSSAFNPNIVTRQGLPINEKDFINLGDYIAVYTKIKSNESQQKPGIHLNHSYVGFMGYGERIILSVDPKAIGFDKVDLPPEVSSTPVGNFTPPAETQVYVEPHKDILNPPSRTMTTKAMGSYDQMRAMGWTDQMLIENGMMTA